MKTINCNYQTNNVKICFENNDIESILKEFDNSTNYFVITDQNINKLYNKFINSIPNLKGICILVSGESSKSIESYIKIMTLLQESNITKNDTIIAIGGGVITDISGFVSGTYKRGIKFINIPTSLIGMVDASIGGKCGINFHEYKNQIGLFNHPTTIYINTTFLETLPKKELVSGISEIIKIAITLDESLYQELLNITYNEFSEKTNLTNFIYKTVLKKIEITSLDEFDHYDRQILNFGHTIGHLIESDSNFLITHGEAVAMGMVSETNNEKVLVSLIPLLKKFGLLTEKIKKIDYLKMITTDKKYNNGYINLINIEEIGHATIKKYKLEDLTNEQFWKEY